MLFRLENIEHTIYIPRTTTKILISKNSDDWFSLILFFKWNNLSFFVEIFIVV